MNTIVLKFGGSSLTVDGFKIINDRVTDILKENCKVVIVVSAVQKCTNLLWETIHMNNKFSEIKKLYLDLANDLHINTSKITQLLEILNKHINNLYYDASIDIVQTSINILSFGEIMASKLLATYLHNSLLISAKHIIKNVNNSDQINPDSLTIKGEFVFDKEKYLQLVLNADVVITQGFIASTNDNKSCLLTRSGSDTSGALIAGGLIAQRYEIWTDVNGMFTADPRVVFNARLIPNLSYNVSQELAAMGSQVIHPYCIEPCKKSLVPIHIRNTYDHHSSNFTIINDIHDTDQDIIYCITLQQNVTIFTIKSIDMWDGFGFMADIYNVFHTFQVDVNIVTTSQFSIVTTTDEKSIVKLNKVFNILKNKYDVVMNSNCSIVSVVGNNIDTNHKAKKAYDIIADFDATKIYITHCSANKSSLSFVIDNTIANLLTNRLHEIILTQENYQKHIINEHAWWKSIDLTKFKTPCYLYSLHKIVEKQNELNKLTMINKIYYAMKANYNKEILNLMIKNGYGIETVSIEEIDYIDEIFNSDVDIVFTPNYCSIDAYQKAFLRGNCLVTVDNWEIIDQYPSIFNNQNIMIRLDLDSGFGHHKKVVTEGENVKFGLPLNQFDILIEICKKYNVTIIGLHSHKGSGILKPDTWSNTCEKLLNIIIDKNLTTVKTLDIGGGFGVWTDGTELDMEIVNSYLTKYKNLIDKYGINIIIEPGRYLVAEAGIIISKINQIRQKNKTNYLGLEIGMNALIRPCLYNAFHSIHNWSKSDEKLNTIYQVVGPICESGDILGKNILLPCSVPGDICVIEHCGAYARSMASTYNLLKIPDEIFI